MKEEDKKKLDDMVKKLVNFKPETKKKTKKKPQIKK